MRVAYVSSFPPIECRVASYAGSLEAAMTRLDIETLVVGPHGAQGTNVFPCYVAGSGDFAPTVHQMLTQLGPDIVHIQHDYELYGPSHGMEIVDLALRLKLIDTPVVVTLHSIDESLDRAERLVLSHLLTECAGVMVHEEFQRETLRGEFGDDIGAKVTVLDHGVREVKPVHDAKRKLGLNPTDKVVALCADIGPTGGMHKAVDFFGEVADAYPDCVMVLAAKTSTPEYEDYRGELLAKIEAAPFASRVQVLSGQFPQHTFDTLLSAADVVVLPYDECGQSDVLSQALAFKRPLVTSQLRAFSSVTRRSGAGVSCADEEYGAQINRILGSKAVANGFTAAADTYVRRRAGWSVIARRHERLYREVLDGACSGGRHVYVHGETEAASVRGMAYTNTGSNRGTPVVVADWLKTAENFDPRPVATRRDVLLD